MPKKVIKENLRLHEHEAENYESEKSEIYNRQEQKRIESVIEEAKPLIETGSSELKALDIGCGTGNILEKLSSRFDKVVGVDLSEDMLSKARSTFYGEKEKIKMIRGKASNLPLKDDYFDMISLYSVLHHFPNFSGPISEIERVLKEGGVLYIDHEPIKRNDLLVKLYIKFNNMLNGEFAKGLPPYEETEGLDRRFCDYHIHHGETGGIPTSEVIRLCKEHGIETITAREYLAYGSDKINTLHALFSSFISNEWLFIGKKS